MPKNKPKRKAHHAKHIHVPVMPELQTAFQLCGHGALAALRLAPSEAAFDQLAGVFNVIRIAINRKKITSPILESGMRALQDVANRSDRINVIHIGKCELRPIELALFECEELVKKLDIITLYVASKSLKNITRLV